MDQMRRTLVIYNPKSGNAAQAGEVLAWLAKKPNVTMRETASASEATKVAAEAVHEEFGLIIAAGGDGTVHAVANGIASIGQRANMGVLPTGTANDFAFTLGMPNDLLLAAQHLLTATPSPMDLIEATCGSQTRYIVNMATGGNSNRVTESLTDEIKQTWGPLSYLRGAISVLADLGSYDISVEIDSSEQFAVRTWNILVANGKTNAGRLMVAPNARPDDGLLDLVIIRDGNFVDLAAIAAEFAILPINYLESDQVIFRQARQVSIQSEPPMKFSIDGEILDEPPSSFRVKPGAINMVFGPDYEYD